MPLKSSEPDVIEMPELRLVGCCTFLPFFEGNNREQFGGTWHRYVNAVDRVFNRISAPRAFGLELYPQEFRKDRRWYYMACCEVDRLDVELPSDYVSRYLAASRYARFTVQGALTELGPAFRYIYDQWLRGAGVKVRAPYDLEMYDERFQSPGGATPEIDILLPIE